jgi:hypothetical protein
VIAALVARQWALAGLAGFIALYALLIIGIKRKVEPLTSGRWAWNVM